MNEDFFADYKNFIVVPEEEKQVGKEVFDPKNYAEHYILTMSIYDSRLSSLSDANKFAIDVEKSIITVLEDFNQKQQQVYHLKLLELDKFKNFFILSLSSKRKFEHGDENNQVSFIIDKMLSNPFYIGQKWFNLVGDKGRVERKLFSYSFKKYAVESEDPIIKQKTVVKKEFI
jgi:hypothetical protein